MDRGILQATQSVVSQESDRTKRISSVSLQTSMSVPSTPRNKSIGRRRQFVQSWYFVAVNAIDFGCAAAVFSSLQEAVTGNKVLVSETGSPNHWTTGAIS